MESRKIVHLKLKIPDASRQDYYFGSLAAIYDKFTTDDVGIGYKSLTNAIRGKNTYENKKCVIRIGTIERKAYKMKKG